MGLQIIFSQIGWLNECHTSMKHMGMIDGVEAAPPSARLQVLHKLLHHNNPKSRKSFHYSAKGGIGLSNKKIGYVQEPKVVLPCLRSTK